MTGTLKIKGSQEGEYILVNLARVRVITRSEDGCVYIKWDEGFIRVDLEAFRDACLHGYYSDSKTSDLFLDIWN